MVERAPHYLWKQKPRFDLKHDAMFAIREQYSAAAQLQKHAEEHSERSGVARRRNRIREQRACTQARKVQNYNNEIEIGISTFGRVPPRPPSHAPKERKHKPIMKDHYYYRRTGFIWADLVHTPIDRAPFAVPQSSVIGDVQALEHIVKELEKEDTVVAEKEQRILDRIAVLREKARAKSQATKFRSRALRGRTLASAVSEREELRQHLALLEQLKLEGLEVTDPGRLAELAGSLPEQDTSAHSPRTNRLAKPKRNYTKKALFMNVGTGDIRGLLVADPALSDHISQAANGIDDPTLHARMNKVLPHTVTTVLNHLEKKKSKALTGVRNSCTGASPPRRLSSQGEARDDVDPLAVLEEAGYMIGGNPQDARAVAAAIVESARVGAGKLPDMQRRGGAQQSGRGCLLGSMGLLALNQPSHFGGESLGDNCRLWAHVESSTSLDTGGGGGARMGGSVDGSVASRRIS
jgi:hypothetical protein